MTKQRQPPPPTPLPKKQYPGHSSDHARIYRVNPERLASPVHEGFTMSRIVTALSRFRSGTENVCPLISKKVREKYGYVNINRCIKHAETGCAQCSLLRAIANKYGNKIGYVCASRLFDWTDITFAGSPPSSHNYFLLKIFAPQGI